MITTINIKKKKKVTTTVGTAMSSFMNDSIPCVVDSFLLGQTVYGVALPVIASIGLALNAFALIAVIASSSSINAVALHYLVSLILSNLALMVLAVPWFLDRLSDTTPRCPTHSYAFYHAHFQLPLLNWTATFSLYILLCMSFERYLSVCRLAAFRRLHRPSTARWAIFISALSAFILQAPLSAGEGVSSCLTDGCWIHIEATQVTTTPYWLAYVCICKILSRFVPSILIILFNIRMMMQFSRLITKRTMMTTNAV